MSILIHRYSFAENVCNIKPLLMHARIQKVLSSGGRTLTTFFSVGQGREDQNTTKSRPLSALNAGLVFQGTRTSIAKKPYVFVIFQGGPDTLPPPPRACDASVFQCETKTYARANA